MTLKELEELIFALETILLKMRRKPEKEESFIVCIPQNSNRAYFNTY